MTMQLVQYNVQITKAVIIGTRASQTSRHEMNFHTYDFRTISDEISTGPTNGLFIAYIREQTADHMIESNAHQHLPNDKNYKYNIEIKPLQSPQYYPQGANRAA